MRSTVARGGGNLPADDHEEAEDLVVGVVPRAQPWTTTEPVMY
jgi:hypothetical protein